MPLKYFFCFLVLSDIHLMTLSSSKNWIFRLRLIQNLSLILIILKLLFFTYLFLLLLFYLGIALLNFLFLNYIKNIFILVSQALRQLISITLILVNCILFQNILLILINHSLWNLFIQRFRKIMIALLRQDNIWIIFLLWLKNFFHHLFNFFLNLFYSLRTKFTKEIWLFVFVLRFASTSANIKKTQYIQQDLKRICHNYYYWQNELGQIVNAAGNHFFLVNKI